MHATGFEGVNMMKPSLKHIRINRNNLMRMHSQQSIKVLSRISLLQDLKESKN